MLGFLAGVVLSLAGAAFYFLFARRRLLHKSGSKRKNEEADLVDVEAGTVGGGASLLPLQLGMRQRGAPGGGGSWTQELAVNEVYDEQQQYQQQPRSLAPSLFQPKPKLQLQPQPQPQPQPDPEPEPQQPPAPPAGGLRHSQEIVRPAVLAPMQPSAPSPEGQAQPAVARLPPSFRTPELQLSDLQLHSLVGAGAFGQVWFGTWKATPVAVKVMSPSNSTVPAAELRAFEEEAAMLERLRHPNICLFLGASLGSGPTKAIITELVSRGSLWDNLRRGVFPAPAGGPGSAAFWPAWAAHKVLAGTARGLLYLHSHSPPIIHRDLKSANLLLTDSLDVKICDFGLARLRQLGSDGSEAVMTTKVGTFNWMAPEIMAGKPYGEKADIYSLGVVAWELLTGKCPYEGVSQVDLIMSVVANSLRPSLEPYFTREQRGLLESLWHAEAPRRTALEALLASELSAAFPPAAP